MAVDATKLTPDTPVWLTEKLKDYDAGTAMVVAKVMPLKGKHVVLVKLPGADARTTPAEPNQLSLTAPGEAAAENAGGDDPFAGPVQDLFLAHAPMEHDLATVFMGDYIAEQSAEDLAMLELAMETAEVPAGGTWTTQDLAKVASSYYEINGTEPSEDVKALIADAEKPAAKAETPKEKAERIKAEKQAEKDKAAAEKAKPDTTAKADKATTTPKTPKAATSAAVYTADKVAASSIAAAMLPVLADAPESFDAVVALAVKMAHAAWAVKAE